MVINEFDVGRAILGPAEADPELLVDADRMLAGAVAL
jgi:hypothetical protein